MSQGHVDSLLSPVWTRWNEWWEWRVPEYSNPINIIYTIFAVKLPERKSASKAEQSVNLKLDKNNNFEIVSQ